MTVTTEQTRRNGITGSALALLRVENLPHYLWEPACGRGAIVSVLRAAGHQVVATDLVDYGIPITPPDYYRRDFLFEQRAPDGCEAIVTNPPFKLAVPFALHALDICPRLYMLLRLAFLEGVGRTPLARRRPPRARACVPQPPAANAPRRLGRQAGIIVDRVRMVRLGSRSQRPDRVAAYLMGSSVRSVIMAGLQECKTAAEVNALARAVNARRQASKAVSKPSPRPATLPARESAAVPAVSTEPEKSAPAPKPAGPPPDPLLGFPRVTVLAIVLAVLRHHPKISPTDLCAQRRTADFVRPRQIAMYLSKKMTLRSLPEIGRRFGGRDHTTVLHAVRKIEALREVDAKLNTELLAIELELNPPPTDDPSQMALPFVGTTE